MWRFFVPQRGWIAYIEGEGVIVLFDGSAWNELGLSLRNLQNLSELGIGTSADATNVLAAKLNNALFTAKATGEGGTGDLRYTLNKSAVGNTVSQLYQDGYSGRAKVGLIGDDNFHVKVSADGTAWHEAINVDKTTGKPSFPSGLIIPNRNTFTDVALDGGTSTFSASFTRIPLNSVNADTGSNWDNTNHWYTCPRMHLSDHRLAAGRSRRHVEHGGRRPVRNRRIYERGGRPLVPVALGRHGALSTLDLCLFPADFSARRGYAAHVHLFRPGGRRFPRRAADRARLRRRAMNACSAVHAVA